ncbi:CGNR zinc finger domain-containing protein [Actinocorallia longicatena]|uniref:CGNR zinc finger domain-containing protein n=1 Tax=Actinocorallia longicatena TaxID=111803 RepID=A0ABP6QN30_9ACTN
MEDPLALRFASTIRATRGGLTDALATESSAREWLAANLPDPAPVPLDALVALRQAVRALFAEAVAPHPPSPADPAALPPFPQALALVNASAAPVLRRLVWDDAPRETRDSVHGGPLAVLADAAVDFFAGPLFPQVRVCPAPRCVLYFLKRHSKQEWCSTTCGNRARAARYYAQHKND